MLGPSLGGLALQVAVDQAVTVVGGAVPQVATPHGSAGQSLFFWLFAIIAVGGAILTITRRNLVSAVMFLVGTFLGISALYAMLYAHFLAVIQILVYAGAIMVLFVFVVMILNKEEEEPWALRGLFGKALAGAALIYLAVRLIQVLWSVPARLPEPQTMPADFGTTKAMADSLFGPYLFAFEAVSLVLLIAVVGALVLAHPAHPNVGEEELS
jgi:NADH-quinone oxidoreductase subunit J